MCTKRSSASSLASLLAAPKPAIKATFSVPGEIEMGRAVRGEYGRGRKKEKMTEGGVRVSKDRGR
jgi:hypothetical protein